MFRRSVSFIAGVAILAVTLGAQQQSAPASATPVVVEAGIKKAILAYEKVLLAAIDEAGVRLANWASNLAPTVQLVRAAYPTVTSIYLPDDSIAFNIDLAEILPTSVELFTQRMQKDLPGQSAPKQVNAANSGGGGMVVEPDPVTAVKAPVNPSQHYSDLVREALIDAIIDIGAMLPIRDGQYLTVQVTPRDVAVRNALYFNTSRKLVLSIAGADLLALQNKTITREQAKLRVLDRRF